MQQFVIAIILFVLFAGCQSGKSPKLKQASPNDYAHGFSIEKQETGVKLTVYNPWEKATNIAMEYYLLKQGVPVPEDLRDKNIIRTPVQRVICLSTTHLAFLGALDVTDALVGVSGSKYVTHPQIRKRIDAGELPDIGYGQNLNYEQIVELKPGLVMMYGVGSEVTSYARKLEELGIPTVMIAEYLEEKPLGKAEWIKLTGALFEKQKEADTFFAEVEADYLHWKEKAGQASPKPGVMVGSPYKDTWWVPGGDSYMANLIADAGGHYLGGDSKGQESYVISFENALAMASQADVWINMGNLSSKKEILAADERFKNFRVFREGKIYNNIKRMGPHGGNDFWESGTVHPHLVLRDLIQVFYPSMSQEEMIYYQEIK